MQLPQKSRKYSSIRHSHIIVCLLTFLLLYNVEAYADSIEVISDTSAIISSDSIIQNSEDYNDFFFEVNKLESIFNSLASDGISKFLILGIPTLFIFGFFIFPILVLILIIYLITKRKKNNEYQEFTTTSYSNSTPQTDNFEKQLKEKEKLIIKVAVGATLTLLFYANSWNFLVILSSVYTIIYAAKLYNIKKRINDNNNKIQ